VSTLNKANESNLGGIVSYKNHLPSKHPFKRIKNAGKPEGCKNDKKMYHFFDVCRQCDQRIL
jgi:hypothetical protein